MAMSDPMTTAMSEALEECLEFACDRLRSGRRQKPVVLHSVRILFRLWDYGYGDAHLLMAALLHDVIEDSQTSIEEIESRFGPSVAALVSSVTFDPRLEYGPERYTELFERCVRQGQSAAILKCADILDNSFYFEQAPSAERTQELFRKTAVFLQMSRPLIGRERVWRDLWKQCQAGESGVKSFHPS